MRWLEGILRLTDTFLIWLGSLGDLIRADSKEWECGETHPGALDVKVNGEENREKSGYNPQTPKICLK